MRKIAFAAIAAIAAAAASAQDTAQAAAERHGPLRLYGDIRLRQEAWDDIPIPPAEPNVTRGGFNNSFRLRTRVGAAWDFAENATANLRLVNMLYDVTSGPKSFDWPDELSIDNANLELRELSGDGSKLVLGRQDIILGSGRLVLEGTPLDASRTTSFDGILLHQPFSGGFSADVFGIYDKDEDPFAVGNVNRQLRGYSPTAKGRDEAAAGVFANGVLLGGALPGSIYYIWKHETSAREADGSKVENADIHTVGLLARPKFSDSLSGEFEFARQFDPADDHGIDATMAFGSLKLTGPAEHRRPFVAANCAYLSGDDPDTGRNEAFNPLFSRYPMFSELVVYCFDTEGAANWNNLVYPHVSLGCSTSGGVSATASAGTLGALERNGAGGGRHRGELYIGQVNFPIREAGKGGFGKIDGHVRLEIFEPGDYYTSNDTSYYLRWEILLTF